ncbi:MAG: hypothetical protein ACPG51_00145 [Thiolinea sp.]
MTDKRVYDAFFVGSGAAGLNFSTKFAGLLKNCRFASNTYYPDHRGRTKYNRILQPQNPVSLNEPGLETSDNLTSELMRK